jgi:UDP:flavonoid glycosyltransferase YjiC (YdhE family)
VRVTFVITPGHGHLYPTLPLADALRAAGHEATYAMIDVAAFRQVVEARGHRYLAVPPSQEGQRQRFAEAWAEMADWSPDELQRRGLARLFVPLVGPSLDPIVEHLRSWRSDLVIHELTAFAGPLAAAIVGIPSVNHGTGFGFEASTFGAGEAMADMWAARGAQPDATAGIYRTLHLEPFPPSLPDPIVVHLDPERVQPIRPVALTTPGERSATRRPSDRVRPLVVATLGTVFDDDPDAWDVIDRSLGALDVEVVWLRPDRFVPIGDVIDDAAVVVAHGGAGTVLAAAAAEVPLVLLPRGADQHDIATAVVAAGIGAQVDEDPAAIAAAVTDALDGTFADRLHSVADEIRARPPPAEVVPLLEVVARRR